MICIASAKDDGMQTIVSIATENGDFKTLLSALNATNLIDTLNWGRTFTVFALIDETFAALLNGTIEALLKDPSAPKKVLLYHVADKRLMAKDVVNIAI